MRFSALSVAGVLLCSAGGAEAFAPGIGGVVSRSAQERAFLVLQYVEGNGRSAEARAAARAARRAGAAGQQEQVQPAINDEKPWQAPAVMPRTRRSQLHTAAPDPRQADVDAVAGVLADFVQSDYALQACNYCNINPTDYGQIDGMFESVRLVDTRLVVKLKWAFEQRSDKLMDRLAKHLRKTMPQIRRLEYQIRSITNTIVI